MSKHKFFAWSVHFYTALGLVAAGGMALAIINYQFHLAFLFMMVATLIDATDGALARLARVKVVLPGFDGRRLDDIIDFQTYTSLPLLLIWRAELLPEGQSFWLLAPLLASAYGFCQVAAKTDDGYFLGFPSYWNIIAFYLYLLQPPPWLTIAVLVTFAILTFVPARYLYPTQRGWLNRLTNQLGFVWAILIAWILFRLAGSAAVDQTTRLLAVLSLAFPIYYLIVSWINSVRILLRQSRDRKRAVARDGEDALAYGHGSDE